MALTRLSSVKAHETNVSRSIQAKKPKQFRVVKASTKKVGEKYGSPILTDGKTVWVKIANREIVVDSVLDGEIEIMLWVLANANDLEAKRTLKQRAKARKAKRQQAEARKEAYRATIKRMNEVAEKREQQEYKPRVSYDLSEEVVGMTFEDGDAKEKRIEENEIKMVRGWNYKDIDINKTYLEM